MRLSARAPPLCASLCLSLPLSSSLCLSLPLSASLSASLCFHSAGQIGYSILYRIASGDMLGKDQPVILQLIELPHALNALKVCGCFLLLLFACFLHVCFETHTYTRQQHYR